MSCDNKGGWERVRQIIRDVLARAHYSQRKLADAASISPSVLTRFLNGQTELDPGSAMKVLHVIHQHMHPSDREIFLKVTGLINFVIDTFNIIAADTSILNSINTNEHKHETGLRLILLAFELERQGLWSQAIDTFRRAESVIGPASSQAAYAAINIARIQISLGHYNVSKEEMSRIQKQYGTVMDFASKGEYHKIMGILYFEDSHFLEAEDQLRKCQQIAQEADTKDFDEHHWLGRLYFEWSRCSSLKEKDIFLKKAMIEYQKAHTIMLNTQCEVKLAYQLFREAQLFFARDDFSTAIAKVRDAKNLFQGDTGHLNLIVEEARIALINGNTHSARKEIEKALEPWNSFGYTSGVARILDIIGDAYLMEGKIFESFEIYLSAYYIHYYKHKRLQKQATRKIKETFFEVARSQRDSPKILIDRVNFAVASRKGYFSIVKAENEESKAGIQDLLENLQRGIV